MEPWLGEIRLFAFSLMPRYWMPCDGSLLEINRNQALFSLIGTFFGGNGTTNFALPDLRGRAIVGAEALVKSKGVAYALGERAGAETVSLTVANMPAHTHPVRVSEAADIALSGKKYFATVSKHEEYPTVPIYGPPSKDLVALQAETVTTAPEGQTIHNNMQPFAVVSYCMAVQGVYPARE